MTLQAKFKEARQNGYTDEEIFDYLSKHEKYAPKIKEAEQEGYSKDEILGYLSKPREKSLAEKTLRVGEQFGISAAEAAVLPYEFGVALPLSSESGQKAAYLQNVGSDIEDLLTQKMYGNWTQEDENLLQNLYSQIEHPETADQYVKTADVGIRDLVEKATGQDLEPENVAEKTAAWLGYLKDPKKLIQQGMKEGINPKLLKELIPGTKFFESLGAGSLMQLAENEGYGPLGKLVFGFLGHLGVSGGKKGIEIAKNPKKFLAESLAYFTGANSEKALAKELVQRASESGIQLDVGSMTNSPIVKWMQARLAQSSLSGDALQNFRKDLSEQVIREYEKLANGISANVFETKEQAAEALKDALKTSEMSLNFPDVNKPARSLQGRVNVAEPVPYEENLLQTIAPEQPVNNYIGGQELKTVAEDIRLPAQQYFNEVFPQIEMQMGHLGGPQPELASEVRTFIRNNQGSLLMGESAAEAKVMRIAENLLDRLQAEGGYHHVTLDELNKTKRTIADIVDWEVGKSDFSTRAKKFVRDIDNVIFRVLENENPQLATLLEETNAEYRAFKDEFANDNIIKLYEPKNENYFSIWDSFVNDPDKLRSLDDLFYRSPRGEEILNQVKRDYARRAIARNNFDARDAENLIQVLGEDFRQPVATYLMERELAAARTGEVIRPGQRLGVNVPIERPTGKSFKGKESEWYKRKKFYESIKDKDANSILKKMDTIKGMRETKRLLELTPEGADLYKKLTRFKLEEMIGKKMTTDMSQQVKLGTFSELLKSSESKALVREILGDEAYQSLRRLQKHASELNHSAQLFFNASQSGTVATDVGIYTSGIIGLLTGQPFLALSAVGTGVGMRVMSNLLADKQFLKHLEKAILSGKNSTTFLKEAKKLEPFIKAAVISANSGVL